MTKFLNISTDTTLGGNSPADDVVSSQKAIKDYTDNKVAKSGDTMTGILELSGDSSYLKFSGDGVIDISYDTRYSIKFTYEGYSQFGISINAYSTTINPITNNRGSLGTSSYKWASVYSTAVYTTKINNGADITVPATSGTMALTSDIPTVNNATLTIQKNGTDVSTFTANASSNVTANITVPTDTNDLTNGAGYITGITSSDVTTALGYTPYSDANPNGYTSNVGTVTSVNNTSPDGSGNVSLTIPTVNNPTITITQGGVTKGSFTLNQASGDTIALDAGGGSSLPSQTGHAGEFLTTDGTDASWANPSITAARNVGDIFFTMRSDSGLNGAVMCDGGTYDTSDYSGTESIGALLTAGKIPYVSLSTYASMLTADGSVGVFGWDGTGTTTFRVPSLNDIFIETGTAAQIGDYVAPGAPNITAGLTGIYFNNGSPTASGALSVSNLTNSNLSNTSGTGEHYGQASFDASSSSSIYGNSATVQPNTIRYRAMVQLFVTATDAAVATCTSVTSQVGTNTSNISTLDSRTTGIIDYVVAKQDPTAGNNYTWYRKYKSGWVEQGGIVLQSGTAKQTVNLPVEMSGSTYSILANVMDDSLSNYVFCVKPTDKTTTSFKSQVWGSYQQGIATSGYSFVWQVSGIAA